MPWEMDWEKEDNVVILRQLVPSERQIQLRKE